MEGRVARGHGTWKADCGCPRFILSQAYELSTLTGTQVLLLVVSESGWVYTFTTDKFKPLVKEDEHGQLSQGQKLIAACLVRRSAFSLPTSH